MRRALWRMGLSVSHRASFLRVGVVRFAGPALLVRSVLGVESILGDAIYRGEYAAYVHDGLVEVV